MSNSVMTGAARNLAAMTLSLSVALTPALAGSAWRGGSFHSFTHFGGFHHDFDNRFHFGGFHHDFDGRFGIDHFHRDFDRRFGFGGWQFFGVGAGPSVAATQASTIPASAASEIVGSYTGPYGEGCAAIHKLEYDAAGKYVGEQIMRACP